ncbi:response regulator transcription factor [Nocardiopsis sp. JB363]|uniref:response regulator transcription factor n=1 Tax=Nocardiopsis sp. JB363 TaxID=1434837 RepID=UPI00097B15DC|nr:response regulator transcription factor [Nocardiopsis sp. JB363]SIO89726.1 Two-component response regulator [Nocardiopsis sp. JB363]
MRVLLIEDDEDLAEVVAVGLRREHLAVDLAGSLAEATEYLCVTDYDVACLDLGLPDGDGLDLWRRMREEGLRRPGRVLVLTARDAVADRIAGLDAGADDYLVKPFSVAELAARVRALSRRRDREPGEIGAGDVRLDPVAHRAHRDGRDLGLTGREFAVLRYLATHRGEVVSTEDLLEHCWDANADPFTGSVRVILSRLRSKLGDPPPITTLRGVGYRFGDLP